MIAIPKTRPKLTRRDPEKILTHYRVDTDKYKVIIIGIRGYYLNTIGKLEANDRGVYDDALIIYSPRFFLTFNANSDPNSYRKGYGFGKDKGIAQLVADIYYAWVIDLHKGQYLAPCQRVGKMTVMRDGDPPYPDRGFFGINLHKGGDKSTYSAGCQTVPPQQWDEHFEKLKSELQFYYGIRWKKEVIPYALIEESDRRML